MIAPSMCTTAAAVVCRLRDSATKLSPISIGKSFWSRLLGLTDSVAVYRLFCIWALVVAPLKAAGAGYPNAILDRVPAGSRNYEVGRAGNAIRWIVIHTTEDAPGSDCSISRNWFKNPASGVSAHYVICQDGTIYRMVDDENTAYHAGNFQYNLRSIGIELERHDDLIVSDGQYQSLARLVRWLLGQYAALGFKLPSGIAPANPDTDTGLICHYQVPDPGNPRVGGGDKHKVDPINFNWDRFTHLFNNPDDTTFGGLDLTVNRAVQVSWPSQDAKQYQIYSSQDLTRWFPDGEPVIGDGRGLKLAFDVSQSLQYFKVEQIPGSAPNRVQALSEISLDAALLSSSGLGFWASNARMKSALTGLDDLVDAYFVFDAAAQVFRLDYFNFAKGVGIYNNPYFAKDVTPAVFLYKDLSLKKAMDQTHTITTTGEAYYMDLEVGYVISFSLTQANDDYTFSITGPDGGVIEKFIGSRGVGVITGATPARKAGRYIVRISPFKDPTVTLNVYFLNANRQSLTTIANNSFVSVTLKSNIRDYAKFKLYLKQGDLLSLDQPDSNIRLTLLNSSSVKISANEGLPFKTSAPTEGYYYLFIDNLKGWGGSYFSLVSIKSGTALQSFDTDALRTISPAQATSAPSASVSD
jgi:N-acetyl-anhydromuramyl-L-alanine amidase AmpD